MRNQFAAAVAIVAALSTFVLFSQPASAQYLGGPLGNVVFQDNFTGGSTIDPATYPTPTANSTGYSISSVKSSSAEFSGSTLELDMAASSSDWIEAQALFTSTPVVLQNTGDTIDFILEFTDTANMGFINNTQNQIGIGLFNSGGVDPLPGTTDLNNTPNELNGGVQTWVGFESQTFGTGSTSSKINARIAQLSATGAEDLLFNDTASATYNNPKGSNLVNGSTASTLKISNGGSYTEEFSIQVTGAGTLAVSNAFYAGAGTGGTLLYSYGGTSNFPGTSVSFDSLAFGDLEKSTTGITNNVSLVEISDNLIPEPSTWLLLTTGLAMVVGLVSRRRRS